MRALEEKLAALEQANADLEASNADLEAQVNAEEGSGEWEARADAEELLDGSDYYYDATMNPDLPRDMRRRLWEYATADDTGDAQPPFGRGSAKHKQKVMFGLASREDLTQAEEDRVLAHPDPDVRACLVGGWERDTSPEASGYFLSPRECANPRAVSPAVLERLTRDPDPYVRRLAFSHWNAPESLVDRAIAQEDELTRHLVAGRAGSLTPAQESRLVSDSDWQVRAAMAGRGDLGGGSVDTLAADPDPGVRRATARRKDLSDGNVDRLASDPDPAVRAHIAARPGLPDRVAERLAEDPDLQVATRLLEDVRRARTAPQSRVVARMAASDSEQYQKKAAHWSNDPETLKSLGKSEHQSVREAAKANRNYPSLVSRLFS